MHNPSTGVPASGSSRIWRTVCSSLTRSTVPPSISSLAGSLAIARRIACSRSRAAVPSALLSATFSLRPGRGLFRFGPSVSPVAARAGLCPGAPRRATSSHTASPASRSSQSFAVEHAPLSSHSRCPSNRAAKSSATAMFPGPSPPA